MSKKTIIISGVNMVEGGIFTILDNCLQKISIYANTNDLKIYALVHDKSKFNYPNIEYIEFPKSKKNWFFRLYYEYYYFNKLSKKINPDIWFSLHDTSPTVKCKRRFVYCHNPNLFYKPSLKDWCFDYKIGVFYLFYTYLYQLNIKKNDTVFVQQHWIKNKFENLFKIKNIQVALPEYIENITDQKIDLDTSKVHFFYPSFPRSYKNFELIFRAIEILDKTTREKISIHFTTVKNNKTSNYAKYIYKNYNYLDEVVFHDTLDRKTLLTYYNSMDCLLFPSKLETWGLPITEAKGFDKPMLVADLPYAKETVGNYENVSFYKVDKPEELAQLMTEFVSKTINYTGNKYPYEKEFQLTNWNAVFDYILE